MKRYSFFFTFLFSVVFAFVAFADAVPQELYISSKGDAHLMGAEYINKHALNLLEVLIWGQRWSVMTDYVTTFESADGVAIQAGDLAEKDILEIKGHPLQNEHKPGYIEATVIRDLSISKGGPAAPPLGTVIAPSVSVMPPEKPAIKEIIRASALSHDLSAGMASGEVALLQEFLQKNNFGIPNDGPVTGYFGPATEKALKKFQGERGLAVTGIADVFTRDAIALPGEKKNLAPENASVVAPKKAEPVSTIIRSLALGMKGDEVMLLQKFLQKNNWGVLSDGVTGYFGPVTVSALKKFQQANGLDVTGTVGPKTRELINSLLKR